jgi:hypothetical protein
VIALQGVVAGGLLRGFTLTFERLTILIDDGDDAAGLVLRLLAGIERPASGRVRVFDVDPASDAALRRDIALLGDPALIAGDEEIARDVARVRGVELGNVTGLRALGDAVANDARARLVLVSYPERYVDQRDAILGRARAALDRGASVVIATRMLDDVLSIASDERAMGVVVARGVVAAAAPAHALPWAIPMDGTRTRVIRVVVEGAAKFSADLLSDEAVASTLALIEPLSSEEVRLHTRDPRALAKAIAERAKSGAPIRAMTVVGATTAELVR